MAYDQMLLIGCFHPILCRSQTPGPFQNGDEPSWQWGGGHECILCLSRVATHVAVTKVHRLDIGIVSAGGLDPSILFTTLDITDFQVGNGIIVVIVSFAFVKTFELGPRRIFP